jgi:hypothetical protein
MSKHVQAARALLAVLRDLGGSAQAETFELKFEQVAWAVGPQDLAKLSAAVHDAVQTPANDVGDVSTPDLRDAGPGADESVPLITRPAYFAAAASQVKPKVPPLPIPPSHLAALADYGAWVNTLPGGWSLVSAIQSAMQAGSTGELAQTVARIFVTTLGYEPCMLDDMPRLSGQKTLVQAMVVAEHTDFCVLVAESRYFGPYTSSLEPLFRLHPYALVFERNATGRIRVLSALRSTHAGSIKYRELRGRAAECDDDSVVWARRLALLKPSPVDDELSLAKRAVEAVTRSAREVACEWDSAALDPASIPGTSWEELPARERGRFLQVQCLTGRLFLGLEAELQTSFPWCSEVGTDGPPRVEVHYHGYEVLKECSISKECVATARHSNALIRLKLEHRLVQEALSAPFSIDAAVVVPDDEGRFVIYGEELHFAPGVGVDDASEVELFEDDAEAWEEETDLPEVQPPPSAVADEAPTKDARTQRYLGASVEALLRNIVGRKLRSVGVRFARTATARLASVGKVRAFLGPFTDDLNHFELSALGKLRRQLVPALGGPRTLFIDTPEPPAWACLDATASLPIGQAYPVAGARIAPGGVIAAPMLRSLGELRLSTTRASSIVTNARALGLEAGSLPSFIARPLTRWASLSPGQLHSVGKLFSGSRAVAGIVLRGQGPKLVLRLDEAKVPRCRVRGVWHVDVPRHRKANHPPRVLVQAGVKIEAGSPLLALELTRWPALAVYKRPALHRALCHIARWDDHADSEDEEQESEEILVRCPPSLEGMLEDVRMELRRDRFGDVSGYRVTFATSRFVCADEAILPDGRLAKVNWVMSADVPYNCENGSTATGLLEDPTFTTHPETDEFWIDGPSGEALSVARLLDGVMLLDPAGPTLPDADLRYRVLDGTGRPRAPHDPMITVGELRQLRAVHPEKAQAVDSALRRAHGLTPCSKTLYELSVASHVKAPPNVPAMWAHSEATFLPGTHDPLKVRAFQQHAVTTADQHGAAWSWSCECAALGGEDRAYETCLTCNTRVAARTHEMTGLRWPAIQLSLPVLHPWRRAVAAALLGLLEGELNAVIADHQAADLVTVLEGCWGDPGKNLLERLRRTDDESKRGQLWRALLSIEPVSRGALKPGDLWLREVRILPLRLLFNGYPGGTGILTQSPISGRYRAVGVAAKLLASAIESGVEPLRQAGWIELQKRVVGLFGEMSAPEPGTLAELWNRVWPTTAPSCVRQAVPGLFAYCSPSELNARRSMLVFTGGSTPVLADDDTTPIARGILFEGSCVALPDLPQGPRSPIHEPPFWSERESHHWLTKDALTRVAGLLLGIADSDALWVQIKEYVPERVERSVLGAFVLREVLLAAGSPAARPSRLRALLEASPALHLPSDKLIAEQKVIDALNEALPGDGPSSLLAKRVLAVYLAGFWRVSKTAENPLGWMWASSQHGVPKAARRTVPHLRESAFRLCRGFRAFTDPLQAAAAGEWNELTQEQLGWLGGAVPELPAASELKPPSLSLPPACLSDAPPTELASPAPDVSPSAKRQEEQPLSVERPLCEMTVVSESLHSWLRLHLSRGSNEQQQ